MAPTFGMSKLAHHPALCAVLADAVLLLHFAFVLFVLVGWLAIGVGYFRRWAWIRNFYFRLAHLGAMGYVAFEAVTGRVCPLTAWEDQLRLWAGRGERYQGSFIQHWVHQILFYEASETVFAVLYSAFFLLIVLSFWRVPPRWPRGR